VELLPKDKNRIASFDVDAQNTFTPLCPDELPVPEGDEIVAELNAQAHYARWRIGSKDAHSPHAIWVANDKYPQLSSITGDNVDVRWKKHAIPGTKGFELLTGLPHVTDYDFFIWKGVELDMHPYGACYHDFAEQLSTGVIEFLKQHNISTIIVGGLATEYCVKNTVLQLLKASLNVIINLAACRGIHAKACHQAITEMKKQGAIMINNCKDLQNDY